MSGDLLDDFSRKRLREMPSLTELRHHVTLAGLRLMEGMLLANYTRRDLDILRAAGMLNGHEIAFLDRLDRTTAEHAALGGQADLTVCAHCGEQLARARKLLTVTIMGVPHVFHGARPACRRAAEYRGLNRYDDSDPQNCTPIDGPA